PTPVVPTFPTRRSSDLLVVVDQGQALHVPGQPQQDALAGRLHAAVQVDGANDGFGGIGEDGFTAETAALEFARAQAQVLAQIESDRKSTRLNSSHVKIS